MLCQKGLLWSACGILPNVLCWCQDQGRPKISLFFAFLDDTLSRQFCSAISYAGLQILFNRSYQRLNQWVRPAPVTHSSLYLLTASPFSYQCPFSYLSDSWFSHRNPSSTAKPSVGYSANATVASTSPYDPPRQSNKVSSGDTSRDAIHRYFSPHTACAPDTLHLSEEASIGAHRAHAQAAIDKFYAQWNRGK